MTRAPVLFVGIASLALGAGLMFWYDKTHRPVCPPCKADVVIMRTNGGLLEVATLRKVETFTSNWVYTVAGVVVGRTTTQIDVPAYYTYRIKLAPEWRILRTGKVFTVITPPFEPSLPVGVDFGKMRKFDGGTWVLAQFNNPADLAKLEKSMSTELARRARRRHMSICSAAPHAKLSRNLSESGC